jgi:hypothetical protein
VSWIEFKVDLKQAISVLTRIAEALERAYPPIVEMPTVTPAPPENLTTFDPEAEWNREQEEERQEQLGLRSPRH